MKTNEIRGISAEEQNRKVKDLKEELLNLRFQNSIGQLENNQKIVQVKRDIARIKTIIRETGRE
jgi:large subunit ribosomal protein L29